MRAKVKLKDSTVYLYPADFTDDIEAEEIVAAVNDYLEKFGRISVLVKSESYKNSTTNAKLIVGEFLRKHKDKFEKLAFVGPSNPLFETAVKTAMAIGGFVNYRFFNDIRAAEIWIKKKDG